MAAPCLSWLPEAVDFVARIRRLEAAGTVSWADLVSLAGLRLDFLQTERLDRLLRRHFASPPDGIRTRPMRLALLGSATTTHLPASIRVAALRRDIWLAVQEGEYGQYRQALADPGSALQRDRPDIVLLAFDAAHLTADLPPSADAAAFDAALQAGIAHLAECWRLARGLGAVAIQQTVLETLPTLMGGDERRLPGSRAELAARFNQALRPAADEAGVHLLAIDRIAAQDGIRTWHDPVLWHRAKQDVTPVAAPVYGDGVGRLVAALQGRSAKCLVLDLDNTLWGGVIGDDGLEGIAIGQGSALGEAFLSVQAHAKALAARGVILAVCSKNDEAVASSPFDSHPDMLLRREDIACFVANWDDKATNLRRIAQSLNIGIDSLVLLDDNPFERNLVRQALPMVAVPEVPDDDPALMARTLADAGYFEAVSLTDEDRGRARSYRANQDRSALQGQATDLPGYLRSLDMRLIWRRFDRIGLGRIVQLVNKTNQFNLTTRRTTEADILAVMDDTRCFGLQLRLTDRFGDNGIVAIVIGRLEEAGRCRIDTWLMSCRVLGRGVETATLELIAEQARALGADTLVGEYRPTPANAMVADHYARLGFGPTAQTPEGGQLSVLSLHDRVGVEGYMVVAAG